MKYSVDVYKLSSFALKDCIFKNMCILILLHGYETIFLHRLFFNFSSLVSPTVSHLTMFLNTKWFTKTL